MTIMKYGWERVSIATWTVLIWTWLRTSVYRYYFQGFSTPSEKYMVLRHLCGVFTRSLPVIHEISLSALRFYFRAVLLYTTTRERPNDKAVEPHIRSRIPVRVGDRDIL
jgi:hypothetical protein